MQNKPQTLVSNNPFDIFVVGARKGFHIAIHNLLPNVVMAYVIAEMLNLPGIMGFIGKVFAPHSDNTWAVCWVCPTCRRSTGHCRW